MPPLYAPGPPLLEGSPNGPCEFAGILVNDMKTPLSILIPIKNEALNLPRCLASISWADEIIVVDSQSTDGSNEIAEAHGVSVVQFHFNGTWPKKKNWALEKVRFKHEWVFILDADEVMPPGAEAEFRQIVTDPGHPADGYWINRRFMFLGKWLEHAYYPNWNLRLFRHRLGRYEKLTGMDTASGDNEVHEHVVVSGKTGRLRCEMDHYAFPSVQVFVEKHNRYSNWEARVALERSLTGTSQSLQIRDVRLPRHLKQMAQHLPCRPLLRFLYVYFWQFGFLDGIAGYHFARLHAVYEYLCVVKTVELKQAKSRPSEGVNSLAREGRVTS
jgi:glycosyltransferase involved in cell wall biosynthesis